MSCRDVVLWLPWVALLGLRCSILQLWRKCYRPSFLDIGVLLLVPRLNTDVWVVDVGWGVHEAEAPGTLGLVKGDVCEHIVHAGGGGGGWGTNS